MNYYNNGWYNGTININQLMNIFPHLNDKKLYRRIMIDNLSLRYITFRQSADLTTKIICDLLNSMGINSKKVKLVDCTSGVGGNVLSFSDSFFEIVAIEKMPLRASYLKNNVDLYKMKNIRILNDSFLNYINNGIVEYSPNVIFIDFPWGDNWTKSAVNFRIVLDNLTMENIVLDIFDKVIDMYNMKMIFQNYNNRILILKLPKNYDIEHLYNSTKLKKNDYYIMKSYLYELYNMILVIYIFYSK